MSAEFAGRYAKAVVDVLAEHFPDLKDDRGYLRRTVLADVARQVMDPTDRFELIVTYTREWRLHPGDVYADRWRVHLVPHKDFLSADEKALVESVNARLRTIQLEA